MRVLWFCIPAYGHTNPTIEVVRALVERGHEVRYYSFEEFRQKIERAGAQFVACDSYLPPVDAHAERRLRKVSTTEMSVQSFRTVANLDASVSEDVASWHPDVIVTDSACFWGKLAAAKHRLPWVCSTTTFAFNEHSSKYMKHSASEIADIVLGLPRLNREIRKLRLLGYEVKAPSTSCKTNRRTTPSSTPRGHSSHAPRRLTRGTIALWARRFATLPRSKSPGARLCTYRSAR